MNHLRNETSPYLLQHVNNPVDWYPWSDEAFQRAREEDKPVLVSIGYSTCHWCHVMEKETFEDGDIASFMNRFFINIKVDREERPDVDHIYMEACQALTGSGGWPLNVFLTPDGRPFYAGTYFPPEPVHNRPSWIQVLKYLNQSFTEKREVVEDQANRLFGVMQRADSVFTKEDNQLETPGEGLFTPARVNKIYDSFVGRLDKVYGGFDGAPKFPATMSLDYMLDYHLFFKNKQAFDFVDFSLKKMIYGGIYDQLGGGFARYATDRAWIIPHFEKMLYDNALLVSLMSRMYQVSGDELYLQTIRDTLAFIGGEMTHPEGGFFSALDADSEGEEGKYYVWSEQEIREILGEDGDVFCAYYQVLPEGNWEGKNILFRQKGLQTFASEVGWEPQILDQTLGKCRSKLLDHRANRIRPGLDDKILLSWNALQCSAFVHAWYATGTAEYLDTAIKNMDFLLKHFSRKEQSSALWHTWKDGIAKYEAFLDDYAFLIAALTDLYEASFEKEYLEQAIDYARKVMEEFWDKESGLFFFTGSGQKDIILRKKDLYDSAMPSGNAAMLINLQKLGFMSGDEIFAETASRMMRSMKDATERYPGSFATWAKAMMYETMGWKEIAIVGPNAFAEAQKLNKLYLPARILMTSQKENNTYPLLAHRFSEGRDLFFLCENFSCRRPVTNLDSFLRMLQA